jgi:hypothetical protein
MNTAKPSRARSSLAALSTLLLASLGGCVIDAKIGDDPLSDEGDGETTQGDVETTSTTSNGYTSGAEPGEDDATTTFGPGSASVTSTTEGPPTATSAGEDEGGTATGGTGVDPESALALCGVEVVPPVPDGPLYIEGIMCAGDCFLQVESAVELDLLETYGDCLCEAMACGPVTGGTTTTGPLPGDTDTDSGDPDGCGDFPDGDAGFTCTCEMCSIDVTNVDAAWVEGEADLEAICECMCGGAGCGLPI